MLKDTDIYARVERNDRTTTINTSAGADNKAESIVNGLSEFGTSTDSLEELIEETDEWLVVIDEWIEDDPQLTIIPTEDARFGMNTTTTETPELSASDNTIGVFGAHETLSNRYGSVMYTISDDALALDAAECESTNGPARWTSNSGYLVDQLQAVDFDAYEHSHYETEWVVVRNENNRGGVGEEHDYEVYIPIEDLEVETDPRLDMPGVPIELPSSARTVWDGPDNIGMYRMNATEILRANPENVPDE